MLFLVLPIFLLFLVNEAAPSDVSDLIEGDKVANCNPNQRDCYEDCKNDADSCPDGADGDYTTNTITFEGVYSSGNACCYKYKSVYTGNRNCDNDTPAQSHWTLGVVCPPEEGRSVTITTSSGGASLGDDKSTCYNGIKFDHECTDSTDPCYYEVCLEYTPGHNGRCCYENGWYMIKAGSAFSFNNVSVPTCICDTGSPTKSPSTDPTESPSTDPTVSPSTDPTKSPSTDPTRSPTTDPTQVPTKSPTPFCRPIIEIKVNEDCTPQNIEYIDTNVVYQNIIYYEDINDLQGPFTDTPQGEMSQIILDHSCDTDDVIPESAHSQPVGNNMIDLIGHKSDAEENKKIPFNFTDDIFNNYIFEAVLILYPLIATFYIVYLKGHDHGRQQMQKIDFDDGTDIEDDS